MLDVTILNLVWTVVVSKDTNQIFQNKTRFFINATILNVTVTNYVYTAEVFER